MWNNSTKALVTALAVGLLAIGLNFVSERWANSKIGPASYDWTVMCSEDNLDFNDNFEGSLEECTDFVNKRNYSEAFLTFEKHHFFSAFALLISIFFVGVVIALYKTVYTWKLAVLAGVILGLAKGFISGSFVVIISYTLMIGVGYILTKLSLKYVIPHKRMQSDGAKTRR